MLQLANPVETRRFATRRDSLHLQVRRCALLCGRHSAGALSLRLREQSLTVAHDGRCEGKRSGLVDYRRAFWKRHVARASDGTTHWSTRRLAEHLHWMEERISFRTFRSSGSGSDRYRVDTENHRRIPRRHARETDIGLRTHCLMSQAQSFTFRELSSVISAPLQTSSAVHKPRTSPIENITRAFFAPVLLPCCRWREVRLVPSAQPTRWTHCQYRFARRRCRTRGRQATWTS